MANKTKVQLGPNAYSFNDQSTGISISRGEIAELSPRQLNTLRVQRALRTGHLTLVVEAKEGKKYTKDALKKLIKKLHAQHEKGMEVSKVAKDYSFEEVTLIAKELGFTVETNDTLESLLQDIFEEFDSESDEKE